MNTTMKLSEVAQEIRKIISSRQKELGLVFEEERHIYIMNGKSDWPSVSKVLKKFYKAFPTEEASYKSGMSVNVTLTAADGTQLYNSAATAFPLSLPVITGITSPTGVLTLTFAVTTEATTTTDANGQTVTVPASTENKTVTRTVTFTQEQN